MQLEAKTSKVNIEKKPTKDLWKKIKKQKALVLMSIPFLIYIFIFCYAPLIGWLMAFQNFKPAKGLFDQAWVGLTFPISILRPYFCKSNKKYLSYEFN